MARNRMLVIALAVLAALLVVALVTTRRDEAPASRTAEAEEPEPLLDCARIRQSPEKLAKSPDPRAFAAAYLCAWSRREVAGMRKTTLSPMEIDDVLRPTVGPETGAERREAIRRRALDAYLHLNDQVARIYDGVEFSIDAVRSLPPELETIFEARSAPRLLEFRAKAPGKGEDAMRTVLAKAGDGGWRFVPGIAEPEPEAPQAQ